MELNDGCLGVYEGKVVAKLVVNFGKCVFPEFLGVSLESHHGANVNFGKGAFKEVYVCQWEGLFLRCWGVGYLGK